jgi:hypothetical protein
LLLVSNEMTNFPTAVAASHNRSTTVGPLCGPPALPP